MERLLADELEGVVDAAALGVDTGDYDEILIGEVHDHVAPSRARLRYRDAPENERILIGITGQPVLAGTAMKRIGSCMPEHLVVADSAEQCVRVATAENLIVPSLTEDDVVARGAA